MATSEQEKRKERFRYLKRKEERNHKLPDLLKGLSEIAGQEINESNVLSIEETDNFQIELNGTNHHLNYLNLNFPVTEVSKLSQVLSALKSDLNKPDNYLSLSHFRQYGLFKVDTSFVLENFEKIIALDKDTLAVYDSTMQNGFWIDYYEEYWFLDNKTQYLWTYELRVFGMDWIYKINNANYALS